VGLLDYQRFVIGYHGTDFDLVQRVLAGEDKLEYSENDHDWLGKGIYFWEHGPRRAYDWAIWRSKNFGGKTAKIKKPAVIGALINLGNCFDLLDTRNTAVLRGLFPMFLETVKEQGLPVPENKHSHANDIDHTKRHLDCAVVNWALQMKKGPEYDTVRCIFSEGEPVFKGSSIMQKSHIQIAVRNPAAILGYFKPNIDFSDKE
jgi:hypothetical protein